MYSAYNDVDMAEAREGRQCQSLAHVNPDRRMNGMSPQSYTGRQHVQSRPQDFSHETLLQASDKDTPSEESWPEEDPQPLPPERKRSSSPSMAFASPKKRFRCENTMNGIHSFHKASNVRSVNNRSIFDSIFAERPRAGLHISSVDRSRRHMSRQTDEEIKDARYSSIQPSFIHDDAAARFQNERAQYARAQSQQPHLRTQRSVSRLRENGVSQVQYQESSPHTARANGIERQELKDDQGRSSELSSYKRFGSIVPDNFSARVEQQRRARQLSQSHAFQPPSLGSAIWDSDMGRPRESTLAAKVVGKYMVNGGLMEHPDSDLPRTPNNRRDRERSVAPRSSATPYREQSVAPRPPGNRQDQSTPFQTPITRRSQSRGFAVSSSADQRQRSSSRHIHTPSFDNISRNNPQTPQHLYEDDGSDTSDAVLEDFFRRPSRGSQRTVRASPFNPEQVLPQSSTFFKAPRVPQTPRPPLFQTTQPILKLRPEPEIIDLCSPVKSVPMKERIPAAKPIFGNRPITKPNILPQNKPKVERKPKIENKSQDENSAEIERQRKLAEAILEKEENARTAALQMEIFGEIVPENEETRKRREKERAENQRQREAAELERATVAEQKRLVEAEKARQHAELAEQVRRAKEEEEARNKVRRDAERKRQEAAEALEREKLRQKTEEKIQADRRRKAAEEAEREREKQKANAIQAEQAELAKLRAKQEETRKQAASLNISKLAALNKETGGSDHDASDSDDDIIENPLFVSDEPSVLNDDPLKNSAMPVSHHNHTDPPTPRRPIGPTTAAAVMAMNQAKKATPSYRDEREARDAEVAKEKMAKLKTDLLRKTESLRRWNRRASQPAQESQGAPQPAASASFPGPKPSSIPSSAVNLTAKGKSASQPTPARKKPTLPKTTALLEQTLMSGNFLGVLTKQPNHNISKRKGPSSVCSSVASEAPANLLSDPQHQKLLEEKAAQEKAKKEAYNAKQRAKATEEARMKQRQKLINEASSAGKVFSEEELNAQVEAFMKTREERILKAAETKAEKERMQRTFPKFGQDYRKESYGYAKSALTNAFETPLVYHSDPEDEILGPQSWEATRAPVRGPLTAVARERGDQFSKSASRKTCADFKQDSRSQGLAARIQVTPGPGDSSEESEEDPDDEPSIQSSHTASNDGEVEFDEYEETEEEFTSDESDEDDDDEMPKRSRKPSHPDSSNRDAEIVRSLVQPSTHSGNPVGEYFSEIEPEAIFLYSVRCRYRKERILQKAKTVEIYVDRNEANKYVRAFLKKRADSRRRPVKVLENYNPITELYRGEIDWELDGSDAVEAVTIWIRRELKTTTNVDNFKDKKYDPRLPNKAWYIKKKLCHKIYETGQPTREKETEDITNTAADLQVANMGACEMFLEFIRPKKIDNILKWSMHWTNEITPKLHKMRDEYSEKGFPLSVQMDTETGIPWLAHEYFTLGFEVQLYDIEGPRN